LFTARRRRLSTSTGAVQRPRYPGEQSSYTSLRACGRCVCVCVRGVCAWVYVWSFDHWVSRAQVLMWAWPSRVRGTPADTALEVRAQLRGHTPQVAAAEGGVWVCGVEGPAPPRRTLWVIDSL
jgi:hypothetical protein